MAETAPGVERIRAAEVIASLCLATDLGMGFPFEHGLQATLTTMRLCDALGVDAETASRSYYAALLAHCGCTVDAEVSAHVFHGSMTKTTIAMCASACRSRCWRRPTRSGRPTPG